MEALSAALYVLAYLLAVVDGTLQDKAIYPAQPGRMGLKIYARKHPWIVVGAICGVLGVIFDSV